MEIVAQSPDRLALVARPWAQSLTYLGMASLATQLSLDAHRAGETPGTFWLVTLIAAIGWGGFLLHAQRVEVTFDRPAGQVRIARHGLFGRVGVIIPLSAVTGVTAERVAPIRRWPWQYRVTLASRAGDFDATTILVPGLVAETQARRAAAGIAAWLDSSRAAA